MIYIHIAGHAKYKKKCANNSFSIHSFNDNYLSIPQYTGS